MTQEEVEAWAEECLKDLNKDEFLKGFRKEILTGHCKYHIDEQGNLKVVDEEDTP